MDQLKSLDVVRPSLKWKAIRDRKHGSDEDFFSRHYSRLVDEIFKLVECAFGTEDLPDDQDPWVNKFPDEFYDFVSAVAHPDPLAGDWKNLLCVYSERTALVAAIILKAIDEHVLSEHLFGADDRHEQILKLEDDALLRTDSMKRTHMRAVTNNTFMDAAGGVPPRFWTRVDELTVKICAMLLPLYNVVREADPRPIEDWGLVYKSVHFVIARAGWINVAASIKAIIVVIEWPTPGELWDRHYMTRSLDRYEASKKLAEAFDEAHKPSQSRMARVKISVRPKVTMVSERDDGKPGHMRCSVQNAEAVFYHGLMDINANDKASVPLLQHAEHLQRYRPVNVGWAVRSFMMTILMIVIVNLVPEQAMLYMGNLFVRSLTALFKGPVLGDVIEFLREAGEDASR